MKARILTIFCLLLMVADKVNAQESENMTKLEEVRAQAQVFLDTCTRAKYPVGLLNNLDDAVYAIQVETAAGTLEAKAVWDK